MRAANNESRLRIVVFPHHSSRLSYHLRTHTSSCIRCLEIVLVLRHGDFSSLVFHEYLHIACGRIFLAHLSAVVYSYARTTVYARIRGTFECALSKYLPRCNKASCLPPECFLQESKRRKHKSFHLSRDAYLLQEASLKVWKSVIHIWRNFNTHAIWKPQRLKMWLRFTFCTAKWSKFSRTMVKASFLCQISGGVEYLGNRSLMSSIPPQWITCTCAAGSTYRSEVFSHAKITLFIACWNLLAFKCFGMIPKYHWVSPYPLVESSSL